MRGMLLALVFCASGLMIGCATTNESALDSRGIDMPDGSHDEWDSVRKEGRGADATEKEWDSWTPKLMSPRAMAIERNLGYGY